MEKKDSKARGAPSAAEGSSMPEKGLLDLRIREIKVEKEEEMITDLESHKSLLFRTPLRR